MTVMQRQEKGEGYGASIQRNHKMNLLASLPMVERLHCARKLLYSSLGKNSQQQTFVAGEVHNTPHSGGFARMRNRRLVKGSPRATVNDHLVLTYPPIARQ